MVSLDEYKLSLELYGHSADVRAVAVGANNEILSGSRDKTMKIWKRTENGYTEAITYQDHKNFVSCVCYLAKEQWICSGSNDATVCIYKDNNYVPILTLKGHESTVCSIAGGVESQSLITGSWDKTARIWCIDQLGGVTHVVLRGHDGAVWAVTSMPADKTFITGGADKCIYYWNVKGEKLRMLKGHTDCVRGLLSLQHSAFASCANDATIRYWNEDGECVQELNGHTNYIYSIALNDAVGAECIVSCGEDSTLRMWNLNSGKELGQPIVHPAQSVWSVACLPNGDIVTGSSDGVIRIFTKDKTRVAEQSTLNSFNLAVSAWNAQISESLGGIKKTDLPGPEALLTDGRDGQTKMVRHADGSVKVYLWEQSKWSLIGDVTGASGGTEGTSGKTLHEGKEYDFVFSVDISDTEPPIKLPYNRGEDPWHAAQAFIHRNNLPQSYLDQVANFIVKNSKDTKPTFTSQPTSSGYQDPFTGGSRYVPNTGGSNLSAGGNVDPFTGGSSYSTTVSRQSPKLDVAFANSTESHFPISKYVTFDNYDSQKVLDKLKEFNGTLTDRSKQVSDTLLESVIKLAEPSPQVNTTAIETLRHLLNWPNNVLFPVLDVTRLAIRNESTFISLNSMNFFDCIVPHFKSSGPNQLMLIRCLANMMCHKAGRNLVETQLQSLVNQINSIKNGSMNLQIGIATFCLNVTISQTLGASNGDNCNYITECLIEFLKWAVDLEACYRAIQAIGNLTTTPFGYQSAAQVVSVDNVMDKIKGFANTPRTDSFTKLNSAGSALLAAL